MSIPLSIFIILAVLLEAVLGLFPTLSADSVAPLNTSIEQAQSWSALINTSSNAFLFWRTDFLHALIADYLPFAHQHAELIVASCIGTVGASLLFFLVRDPRYSMRHAIVSSSLAAAAWTFTLRSLFGFDHVVLASFSWLPWLCITVVWALRAGPLNATKFLLVLFLSWRLSSSANQLAFGLTIFTWLLALACCDRHSWPKATQASGVLLMLSLLLSLVPLAQAPYINTQGFPIDSHVVTHDGLPAMVRALVGESPRIPFINRLWLKHSIKDCAVFLFALSALGFYLTHRRRALSPLAWSALGLGVLIIFDVLPAERAAQLAPLATLARIIPGFFLFPIAYLAIASLPLMALLAVPQRSSLACLTILIAYLVPQVSGPSMRGAFGKLVDVHSQRALAEYSALPVQEKANIEPIIHSPSYSLLNSQGLWVLGQQERLKRTRFVSMQPESASIFSSPNDKRYQLSALTDRDESTRWSTGRASQHGDEWIYIKFDHAIEISALELEVGGFYTDFPRGLRLSTLTPCPSAETSPSTAHGEVRELVEYLPWEGSLMISKFGYPYFDPQHQVRAFLPRLESLECLLIEQTGLAPQHDWSVAELRIGTYSQQ